MIKLAKLSSARVRKMLLIIFGVILSIAAYSQLPSGLTVTSELFNDNIWFFGNQTGNCPGVFFRENSDGTYTAVSKSGEGKVKSTENSLSVSTPSCDGSFVFYTSNDVIYNTKHEPMAGSVPGRSEPGQFWGNNSVADGLAACYIGDNKYFLFSCTKSGEGGQIPTDEPPATQAACAAYTYGCVGLRYYIVDMSKNDGLGEYSSGGVVEQWGCSESIELIPIPGKNDEYWLVYHHYVTNEMRVRRVTPSGVGPILQQLSLPSASPHTHNFPYLLKSNATYNRLALSVSLINRLYLFYFNPTNGTISNHTYFSTSAVTSQNTYGVEFSPGDSYLYFSGYTTTTMGQYNLSTGEIKTFNYGATGGGMKRGPDNKIYVARSGTQYLGVIETPDTKVGTTGFTYSPTGLNLGVTYYNYPLSTGITPPAVDPPGTVMPPMATPNTASTITTLPVSINVVADDEINNGDKLYLASAYFTNGNISQGTINTNRETGVLTFTPNPSFGYTDGQTVSITYMVQDNGEPIAMCDKSVLTVAVYLPRIRIKVDENNRNVDEGQSTTVQVCLPEGVNAPAGGVTVMLNPTLASSATLTDDYTMPSSVVIPQGQNCVGLTINAKADLILEGQESLVVEATAAGYIKGSGEVLITDKTNGEIAVKVNAGDDAAEPSKVGQFYIYFSTANVQTERPVTVHYKIDELTGMAKNGIDYEHITTPGTVIIPAGAKGAYLTVTPKNNFVVEGARKMQLEITSASMP